MREILIIDDDQDLCLELSEILTDTGYAVTTVDNGLRGQELLATRPFALVLLDLRLPGRTGLELLPELKQASQPPRKVIVLSGHPFHSPLLDADQRQREAQTLALADGIMQKPFVVDELLALIARLLPPTETK